MPPKNSRKIYLEDGYYHIYNRGVDKRFIFSDKKDYRVFLRLLKEYLLPLKHPKLIELQEINPRRKPINCNLDIDLLAFCLMPNHFHLFIRQKTKTGLKKLMNALCTNYVMYFNKRYKRIGPLFQGRYKAALIGKDSYFLHITRYIHLNPKEILKEGKLISYEYSSYPFYLGLKKADWLKPEYILDLFRSSKNLYPGDILSYQSFVESYSDSNIDSSKDFRESLLE